MKVLTLIFNDEMNTVHIDGYHLHCIAFRIKEAIAHHATDYFIYKKISPPLHACLACVCDRKGNPTEHTVPADLPLHMPSCPLVWLQGRP